VCSHDAFSVLIIIQNTIRIYSKTKYNVHPCILKCVTQMRVFQILDSIDRAIHDSEISALTTLLILAKKICDRIADARSICGS